MQVAELRTPTPPEKHSRRQKPCHSFPGSKSKICKIPACPARPTSSECFHASWSEGTMTVCRLFQESASLIRAINL